MGWSSITRISCNSTSDDRSYESSKIHDHLSFGELKPGFEYKGERISLINPQRGIFKPQQMRFLSLRES